MFASHYLTDVLGRIEQSGKPPTELALPAAVHATLEQLWQDRGQPAVETGAYLIVDQVGDLVMGPEARGDTGAVRLEPPPDTTTIVGMMHIHPPDVRDIDGIAFSGADMSLLIMDRTSHVSLVRSGDYVFALTRLPRTPERQEAGFYDTLNDLVDLNYELELGRSAQEKPAGLTARDFQEAALKVNVRYCAQYKLALYAGRAGQPLRRIYP